MEEERDRPASPSRLAGGAEAERGVALMEEMSVGLRGCAILGEDGEVLAASGSAEPWAASAGELIAAADAARPGAPAEQVHVATEDGEAFALRFGGLAMVAVTGRFTLASLVLSDMRSILRDLAAGAIRDRRAPDPGVVAERVEAEAAAPPAD